MDIAKYLDGNMKMEEKKIAFEGQLYNYTDIICQYHNVQYAHLLILDLICETNLQQLFVDNMTYTEYKKFERCFLEDIFFESMGDNRFNIYLIFMIPAEKKIVCKYDIQKDFQFARKLFLYPNELENYFRDGLSLKRYKSDIGFMDNYDRQGMLKELYQSSEYAKELCISVLRMGWFEEKRKSKYMKLQREMLSNYASVERYLSNENEISYKEKTVKNRRFSKQEKNRPIYVSMIKSLDIDHYRCFRECKIPFKKVNLLYGENGVGKTTILEAIELGITGYNRNISNSQGTVIRVECINKDNVRYVLSNENQNIDLSDFWYNVKSENCKEFNELFHRFNYFDTNWVSEFAIEGKPQVNVIQLQKYLGIEKIENGKKVLICFYEKIEELAKLNLTPGFKLKNQLSVVSYNKYNHKRIKGQLNCIIEMCEKQLQGLRDENNTISIDVILDKHISKIESIFKLLVAANEFTGLGFHNGQIEAITNSSDNEVQMSQMSTGQKICLALSLMFALFLSLDNAPDVIMLDEPVANLDDMHMLNLLDVLRRLAVAGTQIFFTTANPDVAKLFRRKFSFLENEFAFYTVDEKNGKVKIVCEEYSVNKEEAERHKKIL